MFVVKNKLEIIELLKSGVPRKEISKKFNCSPATISRIIQQQASISNVAKENKNLPMKRHRQGSNKSVEDSLLFWFKDMRSKQATISRPILMEKGKHFANMLNVAFVPTNGWPERWKKRENISFIPMQINILINKTKTKIYLSLNRVYFLSIHLIK